MQCVSLNDKKAELFSTAECTVLRKKKCWYDTQGADTPPCQSPMVLRGLDFFLLNLMKASSPVFLGVLYFLFLQ